MKRNIVKTCALLIIIALAATMLVSSFVSVSQALDLNGAGDVGGFKNNAKDTTNTAKLLSGWLGAALVIVQVVGVGVAVIMLVVLAIKYISAAPSDKADIKKSAVIYVVGAIVLFAASGILGLIRKFANEANSALD